MSTKQQNKYWIEEFQGGFDLCSWSADLDADGEQIVAVHETFTTRQAALEAMREANRDISGDERHFQAQHAYACGYYD